MIDDQVQPVLERMHRLVISAAGARKLRCVDSEARRQASDERAVWRQSPGPVQIDQRRTVTANFDLCLNPILPEPQRTYLGSCHGIQFAAAITADASVAG